MGASGSNAGPPAFLKLNGGPAQPQCSLHSEPRPGVPEVANPLFARSRLGSPANLGPAPDEGESIGNPRLLHMPHPSPVQALAHCLLSHTLGPAAHVVSVPVPLCLQVGPQIPRAALVRLLRDTELLQELALAPCHEWLSDEDLVPVLARNPQLRNVSLAGCGQLSRHALRMLAGGCPRLQRLSLAHCDWVDGLALRGLADRCPALEELDLTACRQLKDEAIVYLAQRRGAGLRSLSLAVNANVGDAAVQELARNCPKLEHLDLTGCLRVGSDSIRTLAEYCPALRSLRVRHCHHVAEPSLSRLRKRGVDIDVEPPLHQALVLLQDMAGFAPFVNLQV
ncbi:PREDICTED: F-box/LRR-repeat protein 15 [Dipodomys ordii]|uniref:F-box/LRR-repeat protein 15 n=1 Tax=Dipodomys ordii TaxID=10020 RepID=A0A1S3FAW9_DIPOR|nr:PREDICTED: F-box/LRR-repeat protein 15 [Dipodomys ordii]